METAKNLDEFRKERKTLKRRIKSTKKLFHQHILASKRPKEVWKLVHHRIFHPKVMKINVSPPELNKHYQTTTASILGTKPTSVKEIKQLLRDQPNTENKLNFQPSTTINEIEKFYIAKLIVQFLSPYPVSYTHLTLPTILRV